MSGGNTWQGLCSLNWKRSNPASVPEHAQRALRISYWKWTLIFTVQRITPHCAMHPFWFLFSRVFFDVGDANTILTIKNAQRSDAGKYEIYVENNFGTDQSFAHVDILWRAVLCTSLLFCLFLFLAHDNKSQFMFQFVVTYQMGPNKTGLHTDNLWWPCGS